MSTKANDKPETVNWKGMTMEVMNNIKQIKVCSMYGVYCTVGKCKIKQAIKTANVGMSTDEKIFTEVDGYRFSMFSGKDIIYTKEFEGDTDEHCYVLCVSVLEDIMDAGIQYIYAINQEEKKIHNAVNKTLISKGLGKK